MSKVSETSTLSKALSVLEVVAESSNPLRFTELMEQLNMPKATLHRMLATLMEERLVRLDKPSQTYHAGYRLLELAHRTWANMDLRQIVADQMEMIRDETNETVHMAILEGTHVIYIDKLDGFQSVRMFSAVGRRGPIYCTGVGKILLAYQDEALQNEVVNQIEFKSFTPHTITSTTDFFKELAMVYEQGYATDREEHEMGIRCVAVPILNYLGHAVAAISVTAPTFRVSVETFQSWQDMMIQVGKEISSRLGPSF